MTTWPLFTDPQFLDANGTGGMNMAMGTVSGAVAAIGSGAWATPGLLAPEAMTVAFSGLVATVGLPRPWGLIASSGAVVRAHGTQTNADTQAYYVEAKVKLSPQLFIAARWNQQLFSSIPGGPYGPQRWSRNVWRADLGPGYRLTPHVQVKVQYSLERQDADSGTFGQMLAGQFTTRF